MKKILINASNLHTGGGVQVATSFISELPNVVSRYPDIEFFVYASSIVDSNLRSAGFHTSSLKNYKVIDVRGLGALKPAVAIYFKGFQSVFTIFGPLYGFVELPNHVVGFAQPWIIYPDNEVCESFGAKQRILTRLKYFLQWRFFSHSARLVVELQHVKDRLVKLKSYPERRVDIVNNCVSSVYFDRDRWVPVLGVEGFNPNVIKLGFVSRDYPHKNIGFILKVAKALKEISAKEYVFFVTLTEAEWASRTDEFRQTVRNVGPISVAQCPSFYQAVDAVFFPSLLECFSATPLEAMVMKKPLFASDRGFVKDCCGSNVSYFDPLDADQAARCIDDWFCCLSEVARIEQIEAAYHHVCSLAGSRQRAEAYLQIIVNQLNK